MRLDKYLKVSRLIKRRTVANEACDAERVTVNGRVQRASYDVKVGDVIAIRFGARTLTVEVVSVTENVGKDAAAVDIPDKQHRRVHHLGEAHVHDVLALEVDFRRAARALDGDDVVLACQALIGLHHRGDKVALSAIVFHRGHIALYASVHDDLTADVRRRLQ